MNETNIEYTQKLLKKTQKRIKDIKELQEEFPDEKGLQLSLLSFKSMEMQLKMELDIMDKYNNDAYIVSLQNSIDKLSSENEWRKEYQRTLESKIRRLKKRIQILENKSVR